MATVRAASGASGCRRRWQAIAGIVIVSVLAVEVAVVIPHFSGITRALAHPRWSWLLIALVAEVSSMTAFARLQRRMLAAGGMQVTLIRAVVLTFAANAISVTLPAGPVLSTGYTFRRWRGWGASASLAAWGIAMSGVLSGMALAVLALLGATLANGGDHDALWIVLELLAAMLAAVVLVRLSRRTDLLIKFGDQLIRLTSRFRRRSTDHRRQVLRDTLTELQEINPRRRDWFFGFFFAALNWAADLFCLIAACHAVGADGPSLGVALIAYAAGMAAGGLPILPGGIGLVDGALVLALAGGKLSITTATAGVLVYRLISFALVASLGWLALILMQRRYTDPEAVAAALPAAEAD